MSPPAIPSLGAKHWGWFPASFPFPIWQLVNWECVLGGEPQTHPQLEQWGQTAPAQTSKGDRGATGSVGCPSPPWLFSTSPH